LNSDPKEELDLLMKRLREEVISVFIQAVSGNDVFFSNPNIVQCWKLLDCKRSVECRLFNNSSEAGRCWQIADMCCGGNPQDGLISRDDRCFGCTVFKNSCPTIVEEIGEHLNNVLYLLKDRNQKIQEKEQHIKHLNQQIKSLLRELDEKTREIQEIKLTDNLTSLYNRHHLITVLEDEIARCHRYGHPLAVMMIDIDDFRSFNDNYGQLAGDRMLAFVGNLIKANIRKFDRAFRYGGEEFVVVLPETDLTMAYIVAERIRKNFQNKSFKVSRKDSKSEEHASRTLSLGITATFTYATETIDTEELINRIEKALSLAKSRGGNISITHPPQ
jgi:diguanylate cyclase (GGDEF)-like protein